MRNTLAGLITIVAFAGCTENPPVRIPSYAVSLNLTGVGMWNTYGVSGFGSHKSFVFTSTERVPSSFPYTTTSATGYGGLLLINGTDPFTTDADVPLAYDLACPVEAMRDVRVNVDKDTYEAVCMKCGSHFDVATGGGRALSGEAASNKYVMRRYKCLPSANGGYLVTN